MQHEMQRGPADADFAKAASKMILGVQPSFSKRSQGLHNDLYWNHLIIWNPPSSLYKQQTQCIECISQRCSQPRLGHHVSHCPPLQLSILLISFDTVTNGYHWDVRSSTITSHFCTAPHRRPELQELGER